MSESDLKTANNAFSEGDLDVSLKQTNRILTDNPGNIEALMLQARVFYKMQRWGDALNNVNKVLEIETDNKLALNYKEMITNIISFWNKDYYNP
jgi:tetratricopeptide (TPR) repeat protein